MALDERLKVSFKTVNDKRRAYLTFDGAPVWLAGRLPSSGSPIVAPDRTVERSLIKEKIRELARVNNTLFKWWMLFYPAFFDHRNDNQSYFSPFARVNGKWDLATPNERYYDALDLTLREAMRHGIVVEIGLFDGPGLKPLGSAGINDSEKRWPCNPWNAKNNRQNAIVAGDTVGAVKTFFTDPGIQTFQRQYTDEVVRRTKSYWNVIYEIMNEPSGDLVVDPDSPAADDPEILWADRVVGWIHAQTAGRRLLFYNAYPRQDISEWRRTAAGQPIYPNYRNFHGVILHGDPRDVTPAQYPFASEKAIQASSDAARADTPDWNVTRTQYCFANEMSFQAHTISLADGKQISDAVVTVAGEVRRTVPLVSWKLLGRFHRKVPNEAWDLRFYIDGTWVAFVPSPYQQVDRGRFTSLGRDRIHSVPSSGQGHDWTLVLDENRAVPRLIMKNEDTQAQQELDLVVYPESGDDDLLYGPFLFNWERIYASNDSPHFSLRFDVDRSFIVFNPGNPATEIQRGDVANLGSDGEGNFVEFFSNLGLKRWHYRFLAGRTELELTSPTLTQKFARRDALRPVF